MTSGQAGSCCLTIWRPEFQGLRFGIKAAAAVENALPGNLQKVIDKKMELTQNTFDQAKQAIGLGLMCTDASSNQQVSLGQVFDIMSRAYQSGRVLASQNAISGFL
ncbi:putative leucine-rich repeat receptor-like serine/threonine-protein kinase [Prunus yedoensis var. nudiflora]|uniref:Putative leucine-rich repeat receptor-like serine/threonine-protein kinase n=1 Tax=Prunus yedoensis var. nudiflora TaxID=2094558 RepID=A0A314XP71_PRUYE|nr:putative leucine-rich repeat receptor-like serine/threonine-protein kinase [Prunus yedoensis var. nudiflora]